MNKDVLQGKWKEIKGDLRKAWGKITDDEFEKTKGDATTIAGIVQQRYGMAKEEASRKVSSIFEKYADTAKKNLKGDRSTPPSKH
ncbi:MAG: CsbD family protein [Bacillota bacterium]